MTDTTIPERDSQAPDPSRKATRSATALVALVVLILATVAVMAALAAKDNDAGPEAASLELTARAPDATASCLPVEASTLATMSPAFAATVTDIDGETVTLDVDRWFTEGDAATVELHAEGGMEALIAGFDFQVGRQYLITADQGSVNFCGFSGEATPELTSLFEQAFPG